MPLLSHNMGHPGYNVGGCYLRDEFLGVDMMRRVENEGGRRTNTRGEMGKYGYTGMR